MKQKSLFPSLIFFFLFTCNALFSSIIEVKDLHQFEQELHQISQDTLVVFDVDYTLIVPQDRILHPSGEQLRQKYFKELAPKFSPEKYSELISRIFLERKIQLVNQNIPALILQLQNKSIKVIALTAMNTGKFGHILNQEDWRIAELKQFNIDFSKAFPIHPFIMFDLTQAKGSTPIFKEGILFSASLTKGEALREFLNKIQWKPQYIIFIDDRMEHLLSVQKEAELMGIHFNGFHYLEAGASSCRIDEALIDFQINHLIQNEKWLSDAEARELVR